MNENTLYISDLDGTLLRGDQTVSAYTAEVINSLIEKGMKFTYATARSLVTARKVTANLNIKMPAAVYNGSFVVDTATGEKLLDGSFARADAVDILSELLAAQIYPIVYSDINGAEKFSYVPHLLSEGASAFRSTRKNDVRDNPVGAAEELYNGDIFYFTCIDDKAKMQPFFEKWKDRFQCIFYRENYGGEQWLEILPKGVNKERAILALKEITGVDRVVYFGDGANDVGAFLAADECYAVENADENLKKIACGVIDSNENDGVARWLLANYDR